MTAAPTARPEAAVRVCALTDLVPERGSVALVGGAQVAIVRTHDGRVYALDNRDPYSGAQIIARGLVGTRGDVPTVISPMYKQVWDLRTGECLDGAGSDPMALRTWPVRVVEGAVLVGGAAIATDRG
ncbi:nitrite reductase small subunit NirD [Janibacter limosus]|uniref:nitrite reductase small subunit NirD n=1 Tax=Janibacter limosus TaxID=53458 RepID=UPI00082E3425|nr:nitrite reductase small subunit NirD [Janibacter limosus]